MLDDVVNGFRAASSGGSTNGTVHQAEIHEPPPEPKFSQSVDLKQWQAGLLVMADRLLRDDPEYRDKPVPAEELLEPLTDDLQRGWRLMSIRPPDDLGQSDIEEECEHIARLAIETWANRNIWSKAVVSSQNGAASPTVDEDDDFEGLPEVFVRKKIEIFNWGQLREMRRTHSVKSVVKGWMNRGETIGWWGKVEHGKTTLLRELVLCVRRGEPFLGRDTVQGRVFYAMLDADGPYLTYDELEKMGFNDEDAEGVEFMFEPNLAQMRYGAEQFFKRLWDWRPDLVIIDPFARLKQITDFKDYNNTYLMGLLSEYAKKIDAAFVLSGHIPRGRPAGAAVETAGFGSVAFGAGVNARFVIERKEGTQTHVIKTSRGKSAEFDGLDTEYVLVRNEETGRVHLGRPYSFADQARAFKPIVQAFLDGAPGEEFSAAALAKALGGMPGAIRTAGNMLFEDGLIGRSGTGKKGSPFGFKKRPEVEEVNKENGRVFAQLPLKQLTPD